MPTSCLLAICKVSIDDLMMSFTFALAAFTSTRLLTAVVCQGPITTNITWEQNWQSSS